ncbi:MAG TPA: hypothetical protein ENH01_12705 [Nitrospirae bacterium]|nr:hypothetical protein [Nitrospirota bacterium]
MLELSISKKIHISHMAEKIFQGISPSRRTRSLDSGKSIPIINVKDIVNGRINADGIDAFIVAGDKDFERYMVRVDDVVITCRGTLLKTAVVPENLDGYLIASNLIVIRLKENFESVLLSTYLQSPKAQKILLANSRSSTMQVAFTVSDIGKIEVPVIPPETQKKLSSLINTAENYYNSAIEAANIRREIAYSITLNYFHENIPTRTGGEN